MFGCLWCIHPRVVCSLPDHTSSFHFLSCRHLILLPPTFFCRPLSLPPSTLLLSHFFKPFCRRLSPSSSTLTRIWTMWRDYYRASASGQQQSPPPTGWTPSSTTPTTITDADWLLAASSRWVFHGVRQAIYPLLTELGWGLLKGSWHFYRHQAPRSPILPVICHYKCTHHLELLLIAAFPHPLAFG